MELGEAEIQVLTSVGARRGRPRKAPLGPECHRRGTPQGWAACCCSPALVTVIGLLLKMRANSDCDH